VRGLDQRASWATAPGTAGGCTGSRRPARGGRRTADRRRRARVTARRGRRRRRAWRAPRRRGAPSSQARREVVGGVRPTTGDLEDDLGVAAQRDRARMPSRPAADERAHRAPSKAASGGATAAGARRRTACRASACGRRRRPAQLPRRPDQASARSCRARCQPAPPVTYAPAGAAAARCRCGRDLDDVPVGEQLEVRGVAAHRATTRTAGRGAARPECRGQEARPAANVRGTCAGSAARAPHPARAGREAGAAQNGRGHDRNLYTSSAFDAESGG